MNDDQINAWANFQIKRFENVTKLALLNWQLSDIKYRAVIKRCELESEFAKQRAEQCQRMADIIEGKTK